PARPCASSGHHRIQRKPDAERTDGLPHVPRARRATSTPTTPISTAPHPGSGTAVWKAKSYALGGPKESKSIATECGPLRKAETDCPSSPATAADAKPQVNNISKTIDAARALRFPPLMDMASPLLWTSRPRVEPYLFSSPPRKQKLAAPQPAAGLTF